MVNLLVADDHEIFIDGLKVALNDVKDIKILGIAKNGIEVLQKLKERKYDVVLLDVKMPDMDGIECAKRIRSGETELKIIVLTQFGDKGLIEKLRKFDVDGYLLKKSSKEEIVQAIRTVQKNEKYYSEEIKAKISNSRDRASRFDYLKCKFSKREEQVLELICKGKTNQQIAEELNLSINSITTYRQRIMIKTGMSNAAELVMWATENDMVDRSKVIDF